MMSNVVVYHTGFCYGRKIRTNYTTITYLTIFKLFQKYFCFFFRKEKFFFTVPLMVRVIDFSSKLMIQSSLQPLKSSIFLRMSLISIALITDWSETNSLVSRRPRLLSRKGSTAVCFEIQQTFLRLVTKL